MKPAVKVEIISFFIFIGAYSSLFFSTQFFEPLILFSLGFMSYVCFFAEFLGKRRAHKAVAFEHASFGFLFYLLSAPVLYLSNMIIGMPSPILIQYLMISLLVPIIISKILVSVISIKKFDGLKTGLIYIFIFGILFGSVSILFLSPALALMTNLFFILVCSTSLLRSYNYFGIKLKSWLQISLLFYILSLPLNFWNVLVSIDINNTMLFSLLILVNSFLFESALGVHYIERKKMTIEKGIKLARKEGDKYLEKVLNKINDRYNVSLTLLAYDIVDNLEHKKHMDLKGLKIV